MNRHIAAMVLVGCSTLFVAGAAGAAEPELNTDEQKTIYTLGLLVARNLAQFSLTEADLELVKAGLADGVLGRQAKVDLVAFAPKVSELQQSRAAAAAVAEKKAAADFLTKAAEDKGAVKTASGLIYTEIKAGEGAQPTPTDKVKVHYTGKLRDGKVFDSSVQRGEPAQLGLDGVIKCWTEGLQLMKVGGKAKLICPAEIAYGDRGAPPDIKPGAALIFEVELLEIVK